MTQNEMEDECEETRFQNVDEKKKITNPISCSPIVPFAYGVI